MSSLNRKITENKTENVLYKNQLNKLKTFDSDYFIGKSHFEEDGTQNYLVFQQLSKYFKDYLLKVLNHLQHLIIVLVQN